MATIYAVATGNWSATTTWASTSGGAAGTGTVPTAADDVVMNAASGAITVTLTANALCRSLDCLGFTGTLAQSTWTIGIGTSTAPVSAIALRLVTTMTYTQSAGSSWGFFSTSATQLAVWMGGKTAPATTFNGIAGSWILSEAFTGNATLTVTNGTLNTNGQTLSTTAITINGGTITLGASSVTLTVSNGSAWVMSTGTVNAGTSTITMTGTSPQFYSGGKTYNNIVFSGSGSATIGNSNAFTCANLTRTGTAAKSDVLAIQPLMTITGTFTVTGNSLTNRVLVQSITSNTLTNVGTQVTITAAAVSLTNVDFMDISGAGAATWSGTSLGNVGGNTGITFTTPTTRFAVAAGGWSGTAMWSATSGGAAGASVPLAHDNVFLDANSPAGTYTVDMPRAGANIDFTGFTRILATGVAAGPWINGNLTLSTGLTISGGVQFTFVGRGAQTITSNGKALGNASTFSAPGGTYTLQDAFVCAGTITLNAGTLLTNNKAFTVAAFICNSTLTRAVTFGTSTVTVTAFGTVWAITTAGLTFSAASSTIHFTDTSANAKALTPNTLTYGTLAFSGGTGVVTITGTYTCSVFQVTGPASITRSAGSTMTVLSAAGWQVSGTAGNLVTIISGTAGTAWTLSVASGIVSSDYLSLKDSTASGGATFYAGAHSTNVSNNTGWSFTAGPTAFSGSASDAVTVSDANARSLSVAALVADSSTINDTLITARGQMRASNDAVSTVDVVTRVTLLARALSDSVVTADSAAARRALIRIAVDSASVIDTLIGGHSVARASSDSLSVSDTTGRSVVLVRPIADGAAVLDTLARQSHRGSAAADSLSVAEGGLAVTNRNRSANDGITVTELVTGRVGYFMTAADFVGFIDNVLALKHSNTPLLVTGRDAAALLLFGSAGSALMLVVGERSATAVASATQATQLSGNETAARQLTAIEE